MLLGFKRRFEPMILDGSKAHTIRGFVPTRKVGQRCDCYVDARQSSMRLLGRWPCTRIEIIEIRADQRVYLAGNILTVDERDLLAWHDGFRDIGKDTPFEQMMEFWRGRLPFSGQVIHWDYNQPVGKDWKGKEEKRRPLVKAIAGGR
jgi:predicted transcriptional regulator